MKINMYLAWICDKKFKTHELYREGFQKQTDIVFPFLSKGACNVKLDITPAANRPFGYTILLQLHVKD